MKSKVRIAYEKVKERIKKDLKKTNLEFAKEDVRNVIVRT